MGARNTIPAVPLTSPVPGLASPVGYGPGTIDPYGGNVLGHAIDPYTAPAGTYTSVNGGPALYSQPGLAGPTYGPNYGPTYGGLSPPLGASPVYPTASPLGRRQLGPYAPRPFYSYLPACCIPCLLLLAIILGGIALALSWLSGPQTLNNVGFTRNQGVFQTCGLVNNGAVSTDCQATDTSLNSGCSGVDTVLKVIAGLSIAALVLYLLAACCGPVGICCDNRIAGIGLPCCGACAVLLGVILQIVALVLMATTVLNSPNPTCTSPGNVLLGNDKLLCPGCNLDVGWYLTLASLLLALLSLCCSCGLCFFAFRRRRIPLRPVVPPSPIIAAQPVHHHHQPCVPCSPVPCPPSPVCVSPCVRPVYRMTPCVTTCQTTCHLSACPAVLSPSHYLPAY